MKQFFAFLVFLSFSFAASANTCVCVPGKTQVQNLDAYGKCLQDVYMDMEELPANASEEQTAAYAAIERSQQLLIRSCEMMSWYIPVDLILVADGVKLNLGTFESKESCKADLVNYKAECSK